jgi:hypothetical protein
VNAGVRLAQNEFAKNKKLQLSNHWRVANEGLAYLVPHVTRRLFEVCSVIPPRMIMSRFEVFPRVISVLCCSHCSVILLTSC